MKDKMEDIQSFHNRLEDVFSPEKDLKIKLIRKLKNENRD